jgi:hypothetical protein
MEKKKITVEVRSILDRVVRSKEIEATEDQMDRYYAGIDKVQDIFPEISRQDREFLISGIDGEEWNKMFGLGPNEDYDEDEDQFIIGGEMGGPFA